MLFLPVVTVCLAVHVAKVGAASDRSRREDSGVTHKDRISYDYRN